MSIAYFGLAFALMLAMMLIGLPIAVSMALVGIVGGIAAYGVPFMDSIAPVVWGVQNENLLTSVPLFVLLGELLLRSGIADRMYVALSAWLGRLPGGLLHTNIGSCALFAATSGSSVATAATIGTVALPSLPARRYPVFVWQAGKLTWVMRTCFISTARVSGMILLIISAAFILNLTISLTGVADAMTKWVTTLGLSGTTMILALIVFYLILGMFMDVLSMQVATIPITYPIVTALGVDPIWYGFFIVLMCELGLITPPVGMNLFVVHGIRPDKGGIGDAIWGALPYAVIMILFTLLLMAVPQLATWLPAHM